MSLRQGSCQALLDTARFGERSLVRFIKPTNEIETYTPPDVPAALVEINRAVRAGSYAAGCFSYELGYAFEQQLPPHIPHARHFCGLESSTNSRRFKPTTRRFCSGPHAAPKQSHSTTSG